eukprot:31511-Pelagococcus_subviridis.AAC.3
MRTTASARSATPSNAVVAARLFAAFTAACAVTCDSRQVTATAARTSSGDANDFASARLTIVARSKSVASVVFRSLS